MLERDGMWHNKRFISIIVFSQSLEAKIEISYSHITEFTSILALMGELYLTGKKPERNCSCKRHRGQSGTFTFIYWV